MIYIVLLILISLVTEHYNQNHQSPIKFPIFSGEHGNRFGKAQTFPEFVTQGPQIRDGREIFGS